MTTKAVEAEKPVNKTGVDENGLAWEDVDVFGVTYRLREITVPESDAAWDAAINPDKSFNSRLNQRLSLASSIVSPTTSMDDFEKWGVRKMMKLLDVYERLNSLPPADTEGKG